MFRIKSKIFSITRFIRSNFKINATLLISIAISFIFTVVGLLAMNMEVFEDAWYIESSADGLFGNVSLTVLCSHFLLTSFIHVLSLTGIRIFWFNIILVIGVFISHVVILYILSYGKSKYINMLEGGCLLSILTPMLLYELNMTGISTYIVVSGCILLLFGIHTKKKRVLVGGFIWSALGGMIRIDCMAFGIIFLGLYLGVKVLMELLVLKFSLKKMFCKCKKEFIVGTIFVIEAFLLFSTYYYAIEKFNPGFLEWNTIRSYVNDYELPEYEKYRDDYHEIGISENDYVLLKTWNNYDSDFFTLDKYKKINNLRIEVLKDELRERGGFYYFQNGIKTIRTQNAYWCVLFAFVCGFIISNRRAKILSVLPLLVFYALIFYFYYRGRLSIHIQYSILISAMVFLHYILFFDRKESRREWIHWGVAFLFILLYQTPYANASILNDYFGHIRTDNSLYFSLDDDYSYLTYNTKVSDVISKDKVNVYFAPVSKTWLQNYPLNVVNPFLTAKKESYSNFAFFSAYMPKLEVTQNIYKDYGIVNPLKDIINDNVRIVVRKTELKILIDPLKRYLREHYYKNCEYKIVEEVEDCVVIKFDEK